MALQVAHALEKHLHGQLWAIALAKPEPSCNCHGMSWDVMGISVYRYIFRKFQVSGLCFKLLDTEHQKLSRLPHALHVHLPRSGKHKCSQIERRFTWVHAGRAILVSDFAVLFVPSKVVFPQALPTCSKQNPTPTDTPSYSPICHLRPVGPTSQGSPWPLPEQATVTWAP